MRNLKIFGIGLIAVIALFAFQIFYAYAVIVFALVPLALLILGQLYLPDSKRKVSVWFNPAVFDRGNEPAGDEFHIPITRLSGKELNYTWFRQSHEFEIVTHRFWLLGTIGMVSLVAAAFASRMAEKDFFLNTMRFLYLGGSAWLAVIFYASLWLRERRMLRLAGLTIGTFSIFNSSRFFFKSVRYYFVDPDGEYRGGTLDSLFPAYGDDITIVFYDPNNPERNIAAAGLNFHKLVWKNYKCWSF